VWSSAFRNSLEKTIHTNSVVKPFCIVSKGTFVGSSNIPYLANTSGKYSTSAGGDEGDIKYQRGVVNAL